MEGVELELESRFLVVWEEECVGVCVCVWCLVA
jgi:hypothetical protein